jgi:CxxC motif-containing protein
VCPLGCDLEAELENGKVVSVTGNTCPRGKVYAETECTFPTRTITSTIKCEDGSLVCVKTDRPIPKDKIFECMKVINAKKAHLPISIGDVIIEDVFGANIVATSNAK